MRPETIELVLPVYNTASLLAQRMPELIEHVQTLAYEVQLHIVDEGSEDETATVAHALVAAHPRVSYTRLMRRGRGHALTTSWLASEADIVGYLDLTLGIDLSAIESLLAPLVAGETDVVVGSRHARESSIAAGPQQQLTSRAYNKILRFTMDLPVHDAQCGFKALRREVFTALKPEITDTQWFFDTELVLTASYAGYRVQEVPIRWVHTRVQRAYRRTAAKAGLADMWRVYRTHKPNSLFTRLFSFGSIGILTLVGYLGMYAIVSLFLPAQASNLLTLAAMTIVNTALNRRFTFRRTGLSDAHKHYAAGLIAFFLSWGVSAGGIWVLFQINPHVSHVAESLWVALFSLSATIVKYFVFSLGFRKRKPLGPQVLEEKRSELV
jgi:glycosyltransferase involved in cell wall biosynthesis